MGSISKASEIKVQLNSKDPIKMINQTNVGGPMMSASSTHHSFKTSPFGETMRMNNNGTQDGSNKMFPDMKQLAPIPSYNLENIQLNLNNVQETQRYTNLQCSTPQFITTHYSSPPCLTTHYTTLQYNTLHYNTTQHNTIHHDTIRYDMIHYSAIQC